jgi:hypothetical protein
MSPAAHSCPRTAARACATGFVERFRRHVQRMRGFVEIVDDDGAGLEGHRGNLSYSLFVRLISSDLGLCLS